MKYSIVILALILSACAATKSQPTPPITATSHKITLNIVSTDEAADGCSLSDEQNNTVALGCKPGCVITFGKGGKVDRQCK